MKLLYSCSDVFPGKEPCGIHCENTENVGAHFSRLSHQVVTSPHENAKACINLKSVM